MLERMEHRGACGCDNDTGDGAGVMTAIPHKLYEKALRCVYAYCMCTVVPIIGVVKMYVIVYMCVCV